MSLEDISMNLFMLIVTGGILAIVLQFLVLDGIAGWLASRIILRPWQHETQVKAVKALYALTYSTCIIVWAYCMLYVGLLDK